MKLYLLTPTYLSRDSSNGVTPIVHYFAREWVKMGHEVCVFHLNSCFPKPFYLIAKMFHRQLSTRLGYEVPKAAPKEYNENVDGVEIHHLCLTKYLPHAIISKTEENKVLNYIIAYCRSHGNPDYFIGHWDIPQLEIMPKLKTITEVPIAVTLHSNVFDYEKVHGENVANLLNKFDAIGFRNAASRQCYIEKYGKPNNCFMAYSGVSDAFINAGTNYKKTFSEGHIEKYIYVGTLIQRKYPSMIIESLNKIYPNGDFSITYIGEGAEKNTIASLKTKGKVTFTGRIPRNEIINYLMDAEVFVMVSKDELFGLVYLEAMALGCIPIAAKGEGIDGIVINGVNGFLCESGNVGELAAILEHINSLTIEQRTKISIKAQETAIQYSDANVAKLYLDNIK